MTRREDYEVHRGHGVTLEGGKKNFTVFCKFFSEQNFDILLFNCGIALAQSLRCCATNRKVAGSIPSSVSGFFIDIKSFQSHYVPGVDSVSNRNEYQEYFLGVKAAGV